MLVTGYGERELETEALQLGAYTFIHKPVQPHELLSLVDRAVHTGCQSRSHEHNKRSEAPFLEFSKERERLREKVRKIYRSMHQDLESTGNETTH